jgi:hypothetical protein
MAKEPVKYKSKSRRKPEYTKEGMVLLEKFEASNKGKFGQELNAITSGARKRGHGRGKARDAGPSRKRGV